MSITAPASSVILAQEAMSAPSSTVGPVKAAAAVPSPSWMERLAGFEGTSRRFLTWWASGMIVATAVRVACFEPGIFGNYLLKNLGPLERERVGWSPILAVRAYDLLLGGWIWTKIEGVTKKDGSLFGALIALLSRVSLYSFEHSYVLLSTQTASTLLLMDVVSLGAAFSLLPKFLPHSPTARASPTSWRLIADNPAFLLNIIFAVGLGTTIPAFLTYVLERVGGMEWIKERVFEKTAPSFLSHETLTSSEMLANPRIPVPVLRSALAPLSMPTHLIASAALSLLSIPLITILPILSPSSLAAVAFLLLAPSSAAMLWGVLPVSAIGAAGIGAVMGLRAAVGTGIGAWVLEELRLADELRRIVLVGVEKDELVVIAETEDGTVVAEITMEEE